MDEDISAIFLINETIPLGGIESFDVPVYHSDIPVSTPMHLA
jgi:hypothetical protein